MTDYAAAFAQGLEAAQQAEVAKKEIDAVFAELNANIKDVSGGRVEIGRRPFKEQSLLLGQNPLLDPAGEALRALKRPDAIVATNPRVLEAPILRLARWQPNPNGYPCKISWAGQDRYCEDKQALENCLLELLRDPDVGRTIRWVMELPPTSPPKSQLK